MSNKLVWSNHATMDYAHSLNDEEKRNYLIDRGYDPEMLGDNDLNSVIADDDYMWQDDSEDFEFNVRPMIEKQCRDGKLVLAGSVGRWDGARNGGAIVDPEDLINLDRDVIDIEIEDDGAGLTYVGHHHDGSIVMDMYHFSEDSDKYKEELEALGVFDEYAKWYDDIEDVFLLSVGDLEPYIDFAKVPKVLPRVVNKMNEAMEAPLDEAKSKDPEGLADELEEIKPLAKDYGFEYFSSMPFTNFDNDPTSVEYQYPEFFKIAKAFFKEMELVDDPNDADELDAQWDSIDAHDWDVIIKVCDKLAGGAPAQQFEKVYKDGVDDHLGDDKEILKKRAEKENELDDLDDEDDDAYAWMDDAENPMDNESLDEKIYSDDFDKMIQTISKKLGYSVDELMSMSNDDIQDLYDQCWIDVEDESLNEAINIGEANAEKFVAYLKNNDCEYTGPFGETPVEVEEGDTVELRAHDISSTFRFGEDGSVDVINHVLGRDEDDDDEYDDIDDDEFADFEGEHHFNTVDEFVDWYYEKEFTWTSDLGADLGEYMNLNVTKLVINDFIDEFDPDGDYENGFVAHDEQELYNWDVWLNDKPVEFDINYVDDDDADYVAYVNIHESLNEENKKPLDPADLKDYPWGNPNV